MSAGDFDGRPLVAGSLIGLRVFRYGESSGLLGGIFPTPFEPGENLAHCADHEPDWFRQRVASMQWIGLNMTLAMQRLAREAAAIRYELVASRRPFGLPPRVEVRSVVTARPPHHVAGVGCACGFYGYTDGRNEYAPGGDNPIGVPVVEAVIEGYGVCTVGGRGFRAEKARLVALIAARPEVAERYGVPVYDDRATALAAHPLTPVDAS